MTTTPMEPKKDNYVDIDSLINKVSKLPIPDTEKADLLRKFKENMMYTTSAEHTPAGVRASMYKLRQQWQPIARKIKPGTLNEMPQACADEPRPHNQKKR